MNSVLFRPVRADDLEGVYQLALEAGIGLTTLPANKKALNERIQLSIESFNKKANSPSNECYFFVLESLSSKKIIGTSAIEAAVGFDLPFFSYALSKKTHICHELNLRLDFELLNCVNDLQGLTELATLFLSPKHRQKNNGLLLSKARLLFIRAFKNKFAPRVIAEMRGVSDAQGNSPFWSSVGEKFFHMSFEQADKLSMVTNKQFINDLMPVHPIYVNMLSEQAKKVIGKPHASTIPAMKILQKEGFETSNYVDIFDAGPTILASLDEIKTIRETTSFTVKNILESVHATEFFISNDEEDFKATVGEVMLTEKGAIISKEVASTLGLESGCIISICPPKWL